MKVPPGGIKITEEDPKFAITLLFFFLGFFNIIFGILGFLCMTIPLVLLFKDRKKTWCQKYCPRANLFTTLFKGRSLGKPIPKWFTKGNLKWIVLAYFGMNLLMMTMSTIMVARGRVEAMDQLRFTIAFAIPWEVPQLINVVPPNWVLHLAYRFYSMMLTTTTIGLILGWVYTPRSWCTICPINTISDASLKSMKKKAKNNLAA